MKDDTELPLGEMDQDVEPVLDRAGQALFRLGRLFSRHTLKDQMQRNIGQATTVSCILVTEAVAAGQTEPDQEITVGCVAERLGIDPSTASRLVAETIEGGYLARLPSLFDSRRIRLTLTDTGRELIVNAHRYQRSVFEQVTKDWTASERMEFAQLLLKFVDAVAETHAQFIEAAALPSEYRKML